MIHIQKISVGVVPLIALLTLAGCATSSSETALKSSDPAPATSATVDKNAILATATATAENSKSVEAKPDIASNEAPDIWTRLRKGFTMKPLDSPQVEREIQWFVNNPEYMQRMMDRARLYLYYITDEVEKRGMPMEIALLPAIESAYKPHAFSRARAVGLWQFMPGTGRLYGLKANWWYDGRRDVETSTQAALDYLEKLNKDFDGDWHLSLAAYNAGEGKIGRMMKYNERKGKSTEYQFLKLKRETQHYVPKLMAMVAIVTNPDKYGVKLASIPNEPYFTSVETGSQVDLSVVAKLVDVPIGDLRDINPGYTRWATDPNGPHRLLVPADKKDALIAGLNNLPEEERVQWLHHAVKRGDTLHGVANRYGITVPILKTANNLRSNLLHSGQDLLIPVSASPLTVTAMRAAYQPPATRPESSRGAPIIHRVRYGETLSSIARRYSVMAGKIAKWNLMQMDDVLRRGQKLKIWTSGGPTASIDHRTSDG